LEKAVGSSLSEYPSGYKLLDWSMIREMAEQGIDFGSHTAGHVVLPVENEATVKTELEASKAKIEKELGRPVMTLAYPNGQFDDAVKSTASLAGYKIALTTETRINRPGADVMALGRTSLCEESTRGLMGKYSSHVADLRLGA
jgi:peptidoglycan/xylan/chitin deacetylase (PgdA/CDA1 family)